MSFLRIKRKNAGYRRISFTPAGLFGAVLSGSVFLLALIGIFYTPYDPEKMDAAAKNLAPCLKHLLGTDNYGRDVLSRIMDGAGTTFAVGLATIAIGGVVGTVSGALTGYFGGLADAVIMRFNDGLLAFPSILLALVLISIFGRGEGNVILALGILFIPSIARVVRGEFIRQREMDYVKNARFLGIGHFRIMFVHILPNILPTLLVTLSIGFNNAVLAEAGLSYLGLGVLPPKASLGRMLSDSQSYLYLCPWTVIFPGLTICFAVLGVTLVSEMLTAKGGARRVGKAEKAARESGNGDAPSKKEEREFREATKKEYNLPLSELSKIPVAVRVRNLTVGYYGRTRDKDTEVLHGISFDLRPGETLEIVGESGSGKSTTALAIMKLLSSSSYTSGSILLDPDADNEVLWREQEEREGRTPEEAPKMLEGRPRREKKELLGSDRTVLSDALGTDISMVFQEALTALNPVKKIESQLLSALRLRKKGMTRTEEREYLVNALREVDLPQPEEVLRSFPHELSGGMRQRVLIAMALLHKPGILIADEPTTALDAETEEEILALLGRLKNKYRMALLFISHDLKLVHRLSDRVLVMKDGRIVERGASDVMFRNPKDPYTRELLQSARGTDFTGLLKVPENAEPAVEVHNLSVVFRKKRHFYEAGRKEASRKTVLSDLSFTIRKGEVFGVLGRSGRGKTTLAKSLLGLLPDNTTGSVRLSGPVGMVFQDPYSSLNPAKTAGWLLSEAEGRRTPKEERRRNAKEMLLAIGLPEEYFDRPVTMLSGGERQRVAIGMVMLAKPDIVILDEPVSALDVTVKEQILKLLVDFHNRYGLTYILISHDADVIERMVTAKLSL